MFYAIPLENRPTWRNPPWLTILLILVNMAVFWGPQRAEENAQKKAAAFYLSSSLPALELPAFVAWLEDTGSPRAPAARRMLELRHYGTLLDGMEYEKPFLARLHGGLVVRPGHPAHQQWEQDRRRYETLQPAPFTAQWAQDNTKDAPFRPVTWITSAFLHADTSHLIGNMVFLFLFGFSVELALGRGLYLAFYLAGALGAALLAGWAYAGQGGYGLGASGAISALMGMYAVMYRLRRIRFFYQLFFYFNYVTAPALLLLPAWIANEVLQHLIGGKGVAYMAHLGGLITGAILMGAAMHWRKLTPPPVAAEAASDSFAHHVAEAKRFAGEMNFDSACRQWRAAAKLRPTDGEVLRAWFNTARLQPAGEDFHSAAHRIFRLNPSDDTTLELQHASYRTYLDQAKPGARLKSDDMARLARRFTRVRQLDDADKLCRALLKSAPEHSGLADTLGICAQGWLRAGQRERALYWLPHLQRLAPHDMATRALAQA
jgi:membrane associated rhomboid family serine protease/Flp pilus assembly protein TadD